MTRWIKLGCLELKELHQVQICPVVEAALCHGQIRTENFGYLVDLLQAVNCDENWTLWNELSEYSSGMVNDLWNYNPSTNQWTWISGSNLHMQPGVYGTQGVPSPYNVPGARGSSVSWIDSNDNFWLFGGSGVYNVSGRPGVYSGKFLVIEFKESTKNYHQEAWMTCGVSIRQQINGPGWVE